MLKLLLTAVLVGGVAEAAPKSHVIVWGKWTSVQWLPGTGENKPVMLKVRPLLVDGRVKEYILGSPHEITERLFAVRRMFRVNDSLPQDAGVPHWQWQRGGWLLVDRMTGRVSPINLPEFDALYSVASWYRDYVAYCGVSDDGNKVFAIVAQLNRRKPVLRKALPEQKDIVAEGSAPDSACVSPTWQRNPTRVSFESGSGARQTFAIRGHVVDSVNDAEEEEAAGK